MQSNYRKYTISLATVLSILLIGNSSCKKLLNQTPKNSTYDQVYWESVKDCESAIAGNYSLLRAALADESSYDQNAFKYYMYGDAETTSTTYFTMNYTGDGLEGIQGGDFTFQYNLQTLGDWTKFYKAIAMSNLVLKKIPAIADEKLQGVDDVQEYKNKVMGQALFIRAYAYFMLTRVYGDVPLVTESYEDVLKAPQLPRSDKALVMKQIEDDCHQAMGLLSWGYTSKGERAVTANRGSVYALLAHLYLWRGTTADLSTDVPNALDVNSADTTIQSLIGQGGYTLVDTAKYGAQFNDGQSTESIFELAMSEDNLEGANYHIAMDFLTNLFVSGYGTTPRCWVPDNYLTTHFGYDKEGDGEGWVWFDVGGWQWVSLHVIGSRYYYNGEDVTDNSDSQGGYAYVYHADIDDYTYDLVGGRGIDPNDVRSRNNFSSGGSQGHNCVKYRNVVYRNKSAETSPYMSNDMILFRLSDMKLLQAEIALYKDDLTSAVTIINASLDRNNSMATRAKTSDGKDNLMREYMLERGREMYLEGHLYWDLIRTRQYREFIPWLQDARFKAGGFFWPIVPTLFQDNRFLTQTSYWRGKV